MSYGSEWFGRNSSTATIVKASIEAGRAYSWNGPICSVCHRGYVGEHTCTVADLQAQIDRLQAHIDKLNESQ